MRRGSALLLGVLIAVLAPASSRAGGATAADTTTTATTTTTTPSYAPLSLSSLPAGCVGAGAVALLPPLHRAIALGTPATNLGPSGYPSSGSVVGFASSSATGSTCATAEVTLTSVSLFGGAVTASSVQATDGTGTATGVEVDGTAVAATAGTTVSVDGWGQLTFGGEGRAGDGAARAPTRASARFASGRDRGRRRLRGFRATRRRAETAAACADPHAEEARGRPIALTRAPHEARGEAPTARAHKATAGLSRLGLAVPRQTRSVAGRSPQQRRYPRDAVPRYPVPVGRRNSLGRVRLLGPGHYVFGKLGIPLPHYAASQYYSPDAVWVSPKRLRPGDLVFFTGSDGTRKEPGYVGNYVSDGYIIDAPHTGAFVRIDSLSDRWFANNTSLPKRIVAPSHPERHLADVSKDTAPVPSDPLLISQRMAGPLAGKPLPEIAAVRTAAHMSRPRATACGPPSVWAFSGSSLSPGRSPTAVACPLRTPCPSLL